MFTRVYLEITNVCNLRCDFCHGTHRPAGFLSPAGFEILARKLAGHTEYLYLHLMGEPLLHPDLPQLLDIAGAQGFKVNLTTNGTLLAQRAPALLAALALHRVNVSLQAWEGGGGPMPLESYVNQCAAFAKAAAARGVVVSLRLWNGGGAQARNGEIRALLAEAFPPPWGQGQKNLVLAERVFLEAGERFTWPDAAAPETEVRFCRGLRDHIGVLWDGTVVPCCLDAEGAIPLGNLYEAALEDILRSPRARAMYDGFSRREAVENLCQHCGYAARF